MTIYVQSSGPEAWKAYLAKPDLHWKTGRSAKTLAHAWEAAQGLPPEIAALMQPVLGDCQLLMATPEHKVDLPGGDRPSQSDVFALIRGHDTTVACMIEGKVDETFGPTVDEWLEGASDGKRVRLAFLLETLGLPTEIPGDVRYQLLHRTVSAVLEAERFMTGAAAMIVHSFSPVAAWRDDYARFLDVMGVADVAGALSSRLTPNSRPIYLGWAAGDQRFREM